MRKINSFLLLLLLSGCQGKIVSSSFNNVENSSSSSFFSSSITSSESEISSINLVELAREIESELNLIIESLPNYISEDYSLPKPQNSKFKIEYEASKSSVFRDILVYEDLNDDYVLNLKVTISYNEITRSSNKDIEVYSLTNPLKILVLKLDKLIPSSINHDLILPQIEGMKISYECPSLQIFFPKRYDDVNFNANNLETVRLLYPYKTKDSRALLKCKIEINEKIINKEYLIDVLGTYSINKLPRIDINTNNVPINSKEVYVNSNIQIHEYNNNEETLSFEGACKVKGRGNSSWELAKKPYAIKFEKKEKLLKCVKSKSYVLLANQVDQSLMRNFLAFNLASKLDGLDFTPTMNYVDLYLNNEYQGNYLLCEKISVSKEKIDINTKSEGTKTGFLVEMDDRAPSEGVENLDYFRLNDGAVRTYTVKEPEPSSEYYTKEKFDYIKNYMANALLMVKKDSEYENYIDIDSFVDWFIVNELFQNVDAGFSSVYFHKDENGKLMIGPIWDLDLSLGNPGHLESNLRTPTNWYVTHPYKNIWYHHLIKSKYFQAKLEYRFKQIYDSFLKDYHNEVFNTFNYIHYSAYQNFAKWDIIGKEYDWYTAYETYVRVSYEEQVQFVYDFLKARIAFLYSEINSNNFPS